MEARILALVKRLAAEVAEPDYSDGGRGGGDRKPVKAPWEKWQRHLQMRLWYLYSVDMTAIPRVGVETALVLLDEPGHDFSEFCSVKKLNHWLGLSPGTNISSGKRFSGPRGAARWWPGRLCGWLR